MSDSSHRPPLHIQAITIFPAFFESVLQYGVTSRALNDGLARFDAVDLRSFTHDRHRTVDDRPFGGGEGMVMKPEPMLAAIESTGLAPKATRACGNETVILLSPQGRPFTQAVAAELASMQRVVLLCGRYEGIDDRVRELACDREISVGDFVLSGGELAAAVVMDATIRLLPGVLGNAASSHYESFGSTSHAPRGDGVPLSVSAAGGLLDYPQYTRPPEFRGLSVPSVLLGGDHAAIQRWRRERALEGTLRNRPDLIERASLSRDDLRFLEKLRRSTSEVAAAKT